MKNLKLLILSLFTVLLLTFTSCNDDDAKARFNFKEGVFISNEGNFSDTDGTVSHITTDGKVTLDLFGKANNKLELGSVVQSMLLTDDKAFIVVNKTGKIEIVNAYTFKSENTLTGLEMPRYLTTYDGKVYFTEWVSYTSEVGRVSSIDIASGQLNEESIVVGVGAENIIAFGDKLYVSNSFTNTVSVIDPVEGQVVKTIEVGNSPGELLVDSEDMIWVVCGGSWNGNNGELVQLDPAESDDEESNSVLKTIELERNISSKAVISKAGDKIVYFSGTSLYVISTSAESAPAEPIKTEATATNFYGIGIDPETDVIYAGDDKGFLGNGVVYRYSLTGTSVDNFACGRGPNGFVFIK